MRSGTITLPRPEKKLLITIRTGQCGSLGRELTLANTLFLELEQADTESKLPEKVDRLRSQSCVAMRICIIGTDFAFHFAVLDKFERLARTYTGRTSKVEPKRGAKGRQKIAAKNDPLLTTGATSRFPLEFA
jgi:hypothetical protein